jgi:16S rRNA (uracil1498-N3)-methyltransferase
LARQAPRHRFHRQVALEPGAAVSFTPEQSAQIDRVLRLVPGDMVAVFDGGGLEASVELVEVTRGRTTGTVVTVEARPWPSPWRPALFLPLIRPQRFEWALEKAVELGAWSITPLLTERTAHGGATTGREKRARWERIVLEAAEQCETAFVPRLDELATLEEALLRPAAARLFAWEGLHGGDPASLARTIGRLPRSEGAPPLVSTFVGPEGGFAEHEASLAASCCTLVSLGPRILRTETAALALLAALVVNAERLSGV